MWVHALTDANNWLRLYAQGSQPWTVQFEARAKWDAWNEVKGMDAEEAKRQYVALLDKVSQPQTARQARAVPSQYLQTPPRVPQTASVSERDGKAALPRWPPYLGTPKSALMPLVQAQPDWENHPALKDYKPE